MQVIGPFRMNATQGPQQASRVTKPAQTPGAESAAPAARPSASPVDQLDLSTSARGGAASSASGPATVGGDMRLDKIADLRRQIAAGTYDTPERFEAALGRMLDDLG